MPQPSLALGKVIERIEDELMARYRRVSHVLSELAGLDARLADSEAPSSTQPQIERIEGMDAVRERIEELSFFSRVSLDSIQPGGPQSIEAIEASRPLDRRAARRGIAMRLIQNTAVLTDDVNRAHLYELSDMGVQLRLTDQPIERMLVFDGETVVVPIEPGNSRRGALVVRQPSLVAGLTGLFERAWQQATVLEPQDGIAAARDEAETLTDADRRLLTLLASGATDEAVARELAVSTRHLRRRISRILVLLGATSRFEAGLEAARRGWL